MRAAFAIQLVTVQQLCKGLSTMSQRRWGRVLPATISKLLAGQKSICLGLFQIMHVHVSRSASREQAMEFAHAVLAYLREYFHELCDRKFGRAPVLEYFDASVAEQRIDGELDALQVEAGPAPTRHLLYRIRMLALRQIAALEALVAACNRRLAQLEAQGAA